MKELDRDTTLNLYISPGALSAAYTIISFMEVGAGTLTECTCANFPLSLPMTGQDIWQQLAVGVLLLIVASSQARISVMYAHDKSSDMVAEQCLNEMFPRVKHIEIQESDESCIIFCVLKKFGIMNSNGVINLEAYRKRVLIARQNEVRVIGSDFGGTCIESAEATQHKQDVCKKAKVFNDCTHLYRILLKKKK